MKRRPERTRTTVSFTKRTADLAKKLARARETTVSALLAQLLNEESERQH